MAPEAAKGKGANFCEEAAPLTKLMDLTRISSTQQLWGRFYNEFIEHATSIPPTGADIPRSTDRAGSEKSQPMEHTAGSFSSNAYEEERYS